MKSTIAAIVALAAVALAAPAVEKRQTDDITFSLSNDFSGHNAPATISVDNTDTSFEYLFGNSVLSVNGDITASSAQLVSNPQNLNFECDIVLNGNVIGVLTQTQTFANFNGQGNPLKVIDVSAAEIICQL
jgi:hypothetical protein